MASYKSRTKGFTLVELIVVVMVILIVVGFLRPAGGSTESATATRLGNRGRSIVTAIITANMEREAAGLTNALLWPKIGQIDRRDSNGVFTATSTANDYFMWLLADGKVEALRRTEAFAEPRLRVKPAATLEEFRTGDHNVWSIVANLDADATGDPPLLFTRNFGLTAPMLLDETNPRIWRNASHWHVRMKPFGHERAAVLTRGAACNIIRGKDMTRSRFVGDAVFNSQTNKDVAIWHAVGTGYPLR